MSGVWKGGLLGLALALGLLGPLDARAHGPLHAEIARLTVELEQHPNDAGRWIQRGEMLRVHGLFSEARLDWDKAAELLPSDVTNDLRLGLIDLGMRQTNSAITRLAAFVRQRPESLEGHLALAEAEAMAEDFAKAVEQWSAAIRLSDEPRPEWYLTRARHGQAAGINDEQVLAGLDEGIARYGPLPSLQLFAVEVEVRRGATDAALQRLDALAARADRKERWLVRRGDVLKEAGRTDEARAEYQAAQRALDQLPERLRRSWTANELRRQIEAKLAELPAPAAASP